MLPPVVRVTGLVLLEDAEPQVPRVDWARLPQAQRLRQARVQQGHEAAEKCFQCERAAVALESGSKDPWAAASEAAKYKEALWLCQVGLLLRRRLRSRLPLPGDELECRCSWAAALLFLGGNDSTVPKHVVTLEPERATGIKRVQLFVIPIRWWRLVLSNGAFLSEPHFDFMFKREVSIHC